MDLSAVDASVYAFLPDAHRTCVLVLQCRDETHLYVAMGNVLAATKVAAASAAAAVAFC